MLAVTFMNLNYDPRFNAFGDFYSSNMALRYVIMGAVVMTLIVSSVSNVSALALEETQPRMLQQKNMNVG
jgi:hypothetical protein